MAAYVRLCQTLLLLSSLVPVLSASHQTYSENEHPFNPPFNTQISPRDLPLKVPLSILCVGDSITVGVGDGNPQLESKNNGYRLDLYNLLTRATVNAQFIGTQSSGTNNPQPRMEGYGGQTIRTIHNNIKNNGILNQQPNLILIHAGTNDNNIDTPDEPVAGAPARLAAMIDFILCSDPNAVVLVALLIQNTFGTHQIQTTAFNAQVPVIVDDRSEKGYKIRAVDMSRIGGQELSDFLHPTADGYQDMANTWYAAIGGIPNSWWTPSQPSVPAFGGSTETCAGSAPRPTTVSVNLASQTVIQGTDSVPFTLPTGITTPILVTETNGVVLPYSPLSDSTATASTTTNTAARTVTHTSSGAQVSVNPDATRLLTSTLSTGQARTLIPSLVISTNAAGQTVIKSSSGAQVSVNPTASAAITSTGSNGQAVTLIPSIVTSINPAGQTVASENSGVSTLLPGISSHTSTGSNGQAVTLIPSIITSTNAAGQTVISESSGVITLPTGISTPTTIISNGATLTFNPVRITTTINAAGQTVVSQSGTGITLPLSISTLTTTTSNGVVFTFQPVSATIPTTAAGQTILSKSGTGISLSTGTSKPTAVTSNGNMFTLRPVSSANTGNAAGQTIFPKSGTGINLPTGISAPTTITSNGVMFTFNPVSVTTTVNAAGLTVLSRSGDGVTLPSGISQGTTITAADGVRFPFTPVPLVASSTSSSSSSPVGILVPYFGTPAAPTSTGGESVITCKAWFFFFCISWLDLNIGGWSFNCPGGLCKPGPPPSITFPPSLHISVNIKGTLPPWPSITIGRDGNPTYSSQPENCKTESAEVCLTSTSYGVSAAATTATQLLSTCGTVYGCEVTDSTKSTTVTSGCTSLSTSSSCTVYCTVFVTVGSSIAPTTCNTASCSTPTMCSLSSLTHTTTSSAVFACPLKLTTTTSSTSVSSASTSVSTATSAVRTTSSTMISATSTAAIQSTASTTTPMTNKSITTAQITSTTHSLTTSSTAAPLSLTDLPTLPAQSYCTQTLCNGQHLLVPKTASTCPDLSAVCTHSTSSTSTVPARNPIPTHNVVGPDDPNNVFGCWVTAGYTNFTFDDYKQVTAAFCDADHILAPSDGFGIEIGNQYTTSSYYVEADYSWAKNQSGCAPKDYFKASDDYTACRNVFAGPSGACRPDRSTQFEDSTLSPGGFYVYNSSAGCVLFEIYAAPLKTIPRPLVQERAVQSEGKIGSRSIKDASNPSIRPAGHYQEGTFTWVGDD